jgi:hypothetical protein
MTALKSILLLHCHIFKKLSIHITLRLMIVIASIAATTTRMTMSRLSSHSFVLTLLFTLLLKQMRKFMN